MLNNATTISLDMMSDTKFYSDYSRWIESKARFETWEESVKRVMDMHRDKYASRMSPRLLTLMSLAENAYAQKWFLGAQRALQFGGEQVLKHQVRLYNCAFSYCDRPRFFQEAMYVLLCGCGVGFSVQQHHVAKLPKIRQVNKDERVIFTIPDSIEGWSDAFGVLISSYFIGGGTFPEYEGKHIVFDYDDIRPKGALISGGFKAPGPEPLRKSLELCRTLLEKQFSLRTVETDGSVKDRLAVKLRPIVAYDFVMHMGDAVLSGGVRRSATICIFSKDDEEMLNSKSTPNWFDEEPQRKRSNNSALLLRDEITKEEFHEIMEKTKNFGEPGFIFASDTEHGYNPCVEIGLRAYDENGESGWQFCNLTEEAGGTIKDEDHFYQVCKAAAVLGTLQAGYTDFKYLTEATKRITEREALIGVGITGWMSNPDLLFNEEVLKRGAEIIKETNKEVAELIGINQAARCTTTKPSGNASVILKTSSGIHGVHAPRYIRNMNINEESEILKKIQEINPKMCRHAVGNNNGTDVCVSYPIETPNAIYNKDLKGVKLLEKVKLVQQTWIEYGTNPELCVDDRLRHNVSNTVTVDDWKSVEDYLFENRYSFAGVSLLGEFGDKDYPQAPFTEVLTPEQIVEKYGTASMFASGLIVDGMHAFTDDLWAACRYACNEEEDYSDLATNMKKEISEILEKYGCGDKINFSIAENSDSLLKRDWARRLKKFANNYFNGDMIKATYCLKDVYNLHHWESLVNNVKPIDFMGVLTKPRYTEVDTMGAMACHGGACEIDFSIK